MVNTNNIVEGAPPQEDIGVIAEADNAEFTETKQVEIEEYINKGYHLIYDEDEAVANLAASNPDTKIESVAEAGFLVGEKIDRSQTQTGQPPYADDVKAVGGAHLVEKIIEFAEYRGVPAFSPEEKEAALTATFQKYMTAGIKNRTIDPIQLAQSVEQVQPGAIKKAMAEIPDNISTDRVTPDAAAQAPTPQAPPQPQGLLNQDSPLEVFLNEQRR